MLPYRLLPINYVESDERFTFADLTYGLVEYPLFGGLLLIGAIIIQIGMVVLAIDHSDRNPDTSKGILGAP